MDKPSYQRAVTPTMDVGSASATNTTAVRGKFLSYQQNQMRRGTGKGTNSSDTGAQSQASAAAQFQMQVQQNQPASLQQVDQTEKVSSTNRNVYGDMGIQGRSAGGGGKSSVNDLGGINVKKGILPVVGTNKSNNDGSNNEAGNGTSTLARFDLVPIVDDIPADGIIFARIRNNPESLVVFRSPEERLRNPERLNLDRRQLDVCPVLEQELRLRLLNFQNNNIRQIQNLENLPNLIFLDLYNNKLVSLEGPLTSVKGLRVLMAGKNRISAVSNLTQLRKLDVLDLHSNDIKQIDGLTGLADLRVLNLAGNKISLVQNLMSLQSLTELNLRRNCIDRVLELDKLPALQRVFLSHNKITNLCDIVCLFGVKFLIELSLDGNPMSEADPTLYRSKIVSTMQGLRHFDLKRVTDEERVLAIPVKKIVEKELGWVTEEDTGTNDDANQNEVDAMKNHTLPNDSDASFRSESGNGTGFKSFDGFNGGDLSPNRGIAALARAGRVPASHSMFDLELIGPTDKALVAVGDAWEWVQAKRLLVNVSEASLYHMKRQVITSKFAANISWLPSLKCLRLFNNELESLKDIDVIFEAFGSSFTIDHLCIRDNPICSLQNLLRAYIIVYLPNLKSFNDLEITDAERQESVRTLDPVLRIHNFAISQQMSVLPNSSLTAKGYFSGALMKPVKNNTTSSKRSNAVTPGRTVVTANIPMNAIDDQSIAEICHEISNTAIKRRNFKKEFDEQLRASVKGIFIDTVLQLHADKK
jgi:hypothetical protein